MPLDPLDKETHPLLGAEIDKYKIIEVLNAGGMGIVFKARQKIMDRDIALKLLPPEMAKDEVNLQRLEREAKALAQLNHPNIIATYDFGLTDSGQSYLAMEYVQGPSLDELLEQVGILKPGRAVYIFKQIADGIRFAHQKGIIHRDLKPQNIMLTDVVSKDQVKILDFGIARIAQDSKRLTRVGEVVGSPIYMAPEQCMGEAADGRADIYAFGVLMFRALTGHFPHMGPNLHETFMAKCTKEPPYFKDVAPRLQLPVELENICRKCLQRKADDRYQQMEQVRDELERIMMPNSATNSGASGAYASQGQGPNLGSEFDSFQDMNPELHQTGWVHFDKNSGSSFRPAADSNSFESLEQPQGAQQMAPAPAPQNPQPFQSPHAMPSPQVQSSAPSQVKQASAGAVQARSQSLSQQEQTIKVKNFAMVIALATVSLVAIMALLALAFVKTSNPTAKEKENSIQEMEKVFQNKTLREKSEEAAAKNDGLNIKSVDAPTNPGSSTTAAPVNSAATTTTTTTTTAPETPAPVATPANPVKDKSSLNSTDYQKARFGYLDKAKPADDKSAQELPHENSSSDSGNQTETSGSSDRGLTLTPNNVSDRIKGKSPSSALRDNKSKDDERSNHESDNKDPDAFDTRR